MREALHERGLLNRNAPHLVWPLGFVVPAYNLLDQPFYGIGLKMYDMLAGKLNLSPSRWLSRRDTLANAPTLAEQVNGRGLKGGVLYYDGQFDDAPGHEPDARCSTWAARRSTTCAPPG